MLTQSYSSGDCSKHGVQYGKILEEGNQLLRFSFILMGENYLT